MRKSASVAAALALAGAVIAPSTRPAAPAKRARREPGDPMQGVATVFRVKLRGHAAAVPIQHTSRQTLLNPPGSCPKPLRKERRARRKARMRLRARRGRT